MRTEQHAQSRADGDLSEKFVVQVQKISSSIFVRLVIRSNLHLILAIVTKEKVANEGLFNRYHGGKEICGVSFLCQFSVLC
jgi:hypothetical protein